MDTTTPTTPTNTESTAPASAAPAKKLLFVEDNVDISFIYKKAFQLHGFVVETAFTGEEGVEKTKSFMPDVILLDIMLPKMSGLEALNIIKADPNTANIPVIILSNLDTDESIKTGFKEKADGYILKAQEVPEQVIDEVEQILQQKNG